MMGQMLARIQFSLRTLLLISLIAALLFIWNPYRNVQARFVLASAVFNLALLAVGLRVRRPIAIGLIWVMIRLAVFLVFLAMGGIVGGDEGFSLFASQVFLEMYFAKIVLRSGVGEFWWLCLVWYFAAGYLFGTWLQRHDLRHGTKMAPASLPST